MKRWIVGGAAALVAVTTWTFVWLEMVQVVIEETATSVAVEVVTALERKQQAVHESATKQVARESATKQVALIGPQLAAACLGVDPSTLSGVALESGMIAAVELSNIRAAKAGLAGGASQTSKEKDDLDREAASVVSGLCRALRGE